MNLFTPNTEFYTNYFDKEKYLLGYRISLFIMLFFSLLISISLISEQNNELLTTFFITFSVGVICLIYILKTKNFTILFWLYAIAGTTIINSSMIFMPNIPHFGDIIWIMVVVVTAFVAINKKVGFLFLAINSLGLVSYVLFNFNKNLTHLAPRTNIELLSDSLEVILALIIFGYLLYKFIEFQSFSEKEIIKTYDELKNKNEFISKQNEENIALVKEVHHRVKNNLQIIISLLRLQKNEIKSDEAKKHFSEAINRIMVMSLIHQKLYSDKSLADIGIKDYLVDLTNDILALSSLDKSIVIQIDSNIEKIGLKSIVPLGLLVNELVSNSLQHAFLNKDNGEIIISITEQKENNFELIYNDNGKWKELKKDYSSFGIELIGILASQLDGDYIKSSNENGTTYTFKLKNVDLENN